MTLFGKVWIEEQVFQWEGYCLRPFQLDSQVTCRGYSLPLQRRIVDFAADVSFESAQNKLKEHYGIDVAKERIRQITYDHAKAMVRDHQIMNQIPSKPGKKQVVVEADGSMIPLVKAKPGRKAGSDQRKNKQLEWKEYRLTLAYANGEVDPVYGGTFGSVEEAGDQMLDVALRAGQGKGSYIHNVGDGATWINDQNERVFGSQAGFLIDYYHLCEYLAGAAGVMEEVSGKGWFNHAKEMCLKKNGAEALLKELKPYVEPGPVAEEDAPVRHCYRYMYNRHGQFKYYEAKKANLPIGSGEIESANRSVVQARLKRAGAWWKKANAGRMIAVRINRANNWWGAYWKDLYQKAA